MDLFSRTVKRRSQRSGVQKTELSEEYEVESEVLMVDSLPSIPRRGRLKVRNKKTQQQEDLVDTNMKLLDGISDLDGVSEEERNQIVQALLNSKKEHSFYQDKHFNEENKETNEGTNFSLESSPSTDGVITEEQLVDNSKDKHQSEAELTADETQAPDSFPSADKEEQLWLKTHDTEEAINSEEEDVYNCSTQVDNIPKPSEKSIPEVEGMDDEATQPLEGVEEIYNDKKTQIENPSSPDNEEKDCSFIPWTLDKIESEADKVEPLQRHYRIIKGKVKRNPEFPLKMPDKLEYAKAILQMFEIYNRKLREAQTKCGNPVDWGETIKVGQHHTKTIDVKRRGQVIMTMSDSDESVENFGMDTNQSHCLMIEETQGFNTNDTSRKASDSTRKSTSKFRINSSDIFEENTFDLVEDGFFNTKTNESQLLRMETQKFTDIGEQKRLGPDIFKDDLNIVAKKSDMDLIEAKKISNNGRRRKHKTGGAEDLDDFESKIRVTQQQNYARPAVKEIQNSEIRNSEKLSWKRGRPKTAKSKAMEFGNGLAVPDDKKDTKVCISQENLQEQSLVTKNRVLARIENDFFEERVKLGLSGERENVSASQIRAKKGKLFPDESLNSQSDPEKFRYGKKKENGFLVEDTQDPDVSEPFVERGTSDEEGGDTTIVQESQPQDQDEMAPNCHNRTKEIHHQTFQKMKETGAELVYKMKKFFTTVQEKDEVSQDKEEGSQSPVYKKRKLLSQNTHMMEAESVAKPGVQRLTNRPASHESHSTDPCSQGSSTMLDQLGELYSTQISIIKEKNASNALTLNNKDMSAKSSTVYELSESEEEDVVKNQVGRGNLQQIGRNQREISMPARSKGRGHSQGQKLHNSQQGHNLQHFQRNKAEVVQDFFDDAEDVTVIDTKNTGLDRMFTFKSKPSTGTVKSDKNEKRGTDKSKGEKHHNRNQGQLQEKKTRTNTVTTEDEIVVFTDDEEEFKDGRTVLPQTNKLPQNSWSQHSGKCSDNVKPGKSRLKLVDSSEKKVLSENCKEPDAMSNAEVSSEPNHATASMLSGFVRTDETLEVDQRNTNGLESCAKNVKAVPVDTLEVVKKGLSVESRAGQNRDLIQAGTSIARQGRRGYIKRKVVDSGRKTLNHVPEKTTEECKKQVKEELVTCPICSQDFPASHIETHAATCMDEDQEEEQQQQHQRSKTRDEGINFQEGRRQLQSDRQTNRVEDVHGRGSSPGIGRESSEPRKLSLQTLSTRDHTPEPKKEAPSLMEICYICDGYFCKGQKYEEHLEGCLEEAKRHQEEVEMKGFKRIYQPVTKNETTMPRTTRSRARDHIVTGDNRLLDGLSEDWNHHEGYSNTAGRSDIVKLDTDESSTCSSEGERDQEDSNHCGCSLHLTPPDWIKDLSSSPIRTFIPISQQEESEYFRNQFAYRLDRVEKAMTKRKRKVSRKKRKSRKRQRISKSGRETKKFI